MVGWVGGAPKLPYQGALNLKGVDSLSGEIGSFLAFWAQLAFSEIAISDFIIKR